MTWLKCSIHKGMFSDELAVNYPPMGTCASSVFVPKAEVEGSAGQQGKVKVVRLIHQGGTAWAVLPSEDQAIIKVDVSDVVEP